MYRYLNGSFQQIGQSWLKHGFCALQQSICASCAPFCGGCCDERRVLWHEPAHLDRTDLAVDPEDLEAFSRRVVVTVIVVSGGHH
jgi:hypothetical protein